MSEKIMGFEWKDILAMQNKQYTRKIVDFTGRGDYGADPIGDGMFRMVPSGDIVDLDERNKRLNERGLMTGQRRN